MDAEIDLTLMKEERSRVFQQFYPLYVALKAGGLSRPVDNGEFSKCPMICSTDISSTGTCCES